jgi:hypothetical protein
MIEVVRSTPKAHRLLQNGECAQLVALREGRPVFSMLTGVDRRFVRISGQRQGWFALVEGADDPEAARALTAAVAAFQRSMGMERLAGPIPPDGQFQPGLKVEGEGAAPHLDRLLTGCGFYVLKEYRAFHIPPGGLFGMGRAAARARSAHGASVRRERFTRASCRAVYDLYAPNRLNFDDFAAWLHAMRPFELYIASIRGADAGFALVRREGDARRVETVMVAPRFQRGPALLCLLDALQSRLGRVVLTGAIDSENAPSLAVARALGGEACELWREYLLYLNQN